MHSTTWLPSTQPLPPPNPTTPMPPTDPTHTRQAPHQAANMIAKAISCAKTHFSTKPRSNSTSSSTGEEPCSAILAIRGICSRAPREGYTQLPIPSASAETRYAWSRGEQNRTSGFSGVASSSFSSSAGSSYTIYANVN